MLIVANWKAYVEDIAVAKKLFAMSKRLAKVAKHSIVLAPSAPLLGAFAIRNKSDIKFAAQDISATTGGAQTGEITAQAYSSAGATYAIIGHSERRANGDTNAIVAVKLSHAIAHGLTPILCVGEDGRDNEGQYLSIIREELTTAVESLSQKERTEIIIAYEPLWAIGRDAEHAIGSHDLTEMVLYVRKVLAELLIGKSSARTLVLYGGSVEPNNVRELATGSGIDGFLIGHASTDTDTFAQLVKQLAQHQIRFGAGLI
jgi:triosephosphate isomerase (TIM)